MQSISNGPLMPTLVKTPRQPIHGAGFPQARAQHKHGADRDRGRTGKSADGFLGRDQTEHGEAAEHQNRDDVRRKALALKQRDRTQRDQSDQECVHGRILVGATALGNSAPVKSGSLRKSSPAFAEHTRQLANTASNAIISA